MMNKRHVFWTALRDGEEGATASEYAVMLALVLAVVIATVIFLGVQVEGAFNDFATLFASFIN